MPWLCEASLSCFHALWCRETICSACEAAKQHPLARSWLIGAGEEQRPPNDAP
jgi:hypothetical protein